LCGLERLSERQRTGFFQRYCRDCFRLHDPRVAYDDGTLNVLLALVRQRRGLTFITGPSDSARTFLITAMGNSADGNRQACGIDVHPAVSFVPVGGVFYPRHVCSQGELVPVVRNIWPMVRDCEAALFIFNGLWSAVPVLRDEIVALAKRGNVLLADKIEGDAVEQRGNGRTPATWIHVSWSGPDHQRLVVSVRSGDQLGTRAVGASPSGPQPAKTSTTSDPSCGLLG
jgi:hypothetical protein